MYSPNETETGHFGALSRPQETLVRECWPCPVVVDDLRHLLKSALAPRDQRRSTSERRVRHLAREAVVRQLSVYHRRARELDTMCICWPAKTSKRKRTSIFQCTNPKRSITVVTTLERAFNLDTMFLGKDGERRTETKKLQGRHFLVELFLQEVYT